MKKSNIKHKLISRIGYCKAIQHQDKNNILQNEIEDLQWLINTLGNNIHFLDSEDLDKFIKKLNLIFETYELNEQIIYYFTENLATEIYLFLHTCSIFDFEKYYNILIDLNKVLKTPLEFKILFNTNELMFNW